MLPRMKTIKYELADGIATLTFDEEGSPVNTMCAQWQKDLTTATSQVLKDKDAIRGIVLASNKSTYFAGADLKATMRLKASDAAAVFQEIEQPAPFSDHQHEAAARVIVLIVPFEMGREVADALGQDRDLHLG